MVIITITSMMLITCSFLFLDSSIFCDFVYFLFAHLKKKSTDDHMHAHQSVIQTS